MDTVTCWVPDGAVRVCFSPGRRVPALLLPLLRWLQLGFARLLPSLPVAALSQAGREFPNPNQSSLLPPCKGGGRGFGQPRGLAGHMGSLRVPLPQLQLRPGSSSHATLCLQMLPGFAPGPVSSCSIVPCRGVSTRRLCVTPCHRATWHGSEVTAVINPLFKKLFITVCPEPPGGRGLGPRQGDEYPSCVGGPAACVCRQESSLCGDISAARPFPPRSMGTGTGTSWQSPQIRSLHTPRSSLLLGQTRGRCPKPGHLGRSAPCLSFPWGDSGGCLCLCHGPGPPKCPAVQGGLRGSPDMGVPVPSPQPAAG